MALLCSFAGQVCHKKWWLAKYFVDHMDIWYMYTEMGNYTCKEMQLKFQILPNHSASVTTPKVHGIALNLPAAHHVVVMQIIWLFTIQLQVFASIVWLGQNAVQHTWLLNMGPGYYDIHVSNLHRHSGVVHIPVLHHLTRQLNILAFMIYSFLESCDDHTKQLTEDRDTLISD